MNKNPNKNARFWYSLYELLSSMRFAVGLLTILSLASIIGTVLQQNQPYPSYLMEFGAYWFAIFEFLGLFDIYHSSWFLLLLGFLVVSTTLCVWRNTPAFVRDIRQWRENISEKSLKAMQYSVALPAVAVNDAEAFLKQNNLRTKKFVRRNDEVLLIGRRGSSNRLGYFFAHIALVVICLGGLMDGNIPLKIKELIGSKQAETRDLPQGDVPESARLGQDNLSFRGNVTIPENQSADVVFLNAGRGYFVQELPFIVTLKKFSIEHYDNGMPKLFASDIVVKNKTTGKETQARIEVNKPLSIDGITLYQSSFGDGGSPLKLKAWNLAHPHGVPVSIIGRSMNTQPLMVNQKQYQLEFGELRVFNIQDMSDPAAMPIEKNIKDVLNDARSVTQDKNLRNVGPSIQFKLRDAQGQAVEYFNYMSPMLLDERLYMVTGQRKAPNEPFSYLRLPLDENTSLDGFMRLFAAMRDEDLLQKAAKITAQKALEGDAISQEMQSQFQNSVLWVLQRFAAGGFSALEDFLDDRVPQDKRQAVAQTYIKILQGAIADVDDLAREKANIAKQNMSPEHYRFLLDALVAMSGLTLEYAAPVYLALDGFNEVPASGLQMTRSPGQNIVYLGSFLLILGIIFMFYVRDLRLWLYFSGGQMQLAVASNRKTPELARDFERLQSGLRDLAQGKQNTLKPAHSSGGQNQ